MANELNGEKDKPANPAGTYTHKESGEKLHVTDPIQGDAVVRLGFERTGDLPKKAERSTGTSANTAEATRTYSEARLAQAEAAEAKAREIELDEQAKKAEAAGGAADTVEEEQKKQTNGKK